MSRMAEQAQDQQERENESGIDLCEAWHEHNRRLIEEIHEITETQIKPTSGYQLEPIAGRTSAYPF